MKVYEIINPSDPYTMVAASPAVAAAVCLVLGRGAYGLDAANGSSACPLFLFGGGPEWFEREHGEALQAFLDSHGGEIVAALRSVLVGRLEERTVLEETLAELPEESRASFLAKRHDKLRSSLNDIGGAAQAIAEHLERPADARGAEAAAGGPP